MILIKVNFVEELREWFRILSKLKKCRKIGKGGWIPMWHSNGKAEIIDLNLDIYDA